MPAVQFNGGLASASRRKTSNVLSSKENELDFRERHRRLSIWNKFGFWGSVASLAGLAMAVYPIWVSSIATKQRDIPPHRRAVSRDPISPPANVVGAVEDSLADRVVDSIAAAQGLRRLAVLETGKSDTPRGTYSWTYARYFRLSAERGDSGRLLVGVVPPRESNDQFRVHHLPDGERLVVCFVSSESSARLAGALDSEAQTLVAFPKPWGEFRYLVLLRLTRIDSVSDRTITLPTGQEKWLLDVTMK